MIKKEYWFDVHMRGLETVAVWGTYAATFKVGEYDVVSHSLDVHSLYEYITQRETAESVVLLVQLAQQAAA